MVTPRARPWLDRYEHPLPIRSRGAFHLLSAARCSDARACVVVVPSPFEEHVPAAETFREIERVHALLDHPIIPRVTALGVASGTPYLELDCDATMDGVEVHELLADTGCKVPIPFADGFVAVLHQAMKSAHAVTDPLLGHEVCLGRLSPANLLFARSGRFFLTGYGHNLAFDPAQTQTSAEGWAPLFAAPEVLQGEPPTPAADHVALLLFARTLLPLVDLEPALTRLLDSPPGPDDAALLRHLRWLDGHIIAPPARRRRTVAELDIAVARLRSLCAVTPDPGGLELFLRDVFETWTPDAHGTLDAWGDVLGTA